MPLEIRLLHSYLLWKLFVCWGMGVFFWLCVASQSLLCFCSLFLSFVVMHFLVYGVKHEPALQQFLSQIHLPRHANKALIKRHSIIHSGAVALVADVMFLSFPGRCFQSIARRDERRATTSHFCFHPVLHAYRRVSNVA